jgi:hypothetical protein
VTAEDIPTVHADALLALLRADENLTVYPPPEPEPGQVVPVGARPPYVSVHVRVTVPPEGVRSITGEADRVVARAYCHSVGANDAQARLVAGRVMAALLNVRPVIAGRSCWPIRHEASGGEPARDESTGTAVVDQIDVYRLETTPAPI